MDKQSTDHQENETRAQASHGHAAAPIDSSVNWICLEKVDKTQWMEQLPLPGTATEKVILLKQWHRSRLGWWNRMLAVLLCREFFVAFGTLEMDLPTPRSRDFCEVQIDAVIRNDILIRGFTSPKSLAGQPNLFDRLPDFSAYRPTGLESLTTHHVLVIAHRLNKIRVFGAFLLAASATLVLSLVVGIARHNVGLSVAIGATIFGFIATIQVAVVWMCR
ncbi:uncharacterized protein LTR77_005327 [Saxophila tyrrhenica]|uniref:Uncharacterized protein n=1 Tax=Saxophila tyrrhenica TaxID=1690608 RepID=A0AAV9PC64_9PEZI|nr:hypothetical protein LTR77_005327 [Saxophila tyrrhenica]